MLIKGLVLVGFSFLLTLPSTSPQSMSCAASATKKNRRLDVVGVAHSSVPPAASATQQHADPDLDDMSAHVHRRPQRTRFFQWVPTDSDQLQSAERSLLQSIRGFFTQSMVAGLNTISSVHPSSGQTVVLLHGFGGGVGNWVPNWRILARQYTTYAVDLPGFGRSERPHVHFKDEHEAIDFMVEKLHAWVVESGVHLPVSLVGHSFGGYIAAYYAMRYPADVEKLVLADPWGVPPEEKRELPWKWRALKWIFYKLNPLTVLRAAGPWGPTLLPSVRKDFADRWSSHIDDPMVFYDYTFHCNAGYPCGERAFQACCTGTAYAKQPLLNTLPSGLVPSIPLGVLYGAHTWMDQDAGRRMVDAVQKDRVSAVAGGLAAAWTRMDTVSGAGHQLNTDNAEEFCDKLSTLLDTPATRTSPRG